MNEYDKKKQAELSRLVDCFRDSANAIAARYLSHTRLLDIDYDIEKLGRQRDSKFWGNWIFRLHPGEEPLFLAWIDTLLKENVRIRLDFTDLHAADLKRGNMPDTIFWFANLREVKFAYANLQDSDFKEADMADIDLFEANLREVRLSEARVTRGNMRLADVTGACFFRTNIEGADLRGAVGLTLEQLVDAIISKDTQLDPKFDLFKAQRLEKIEREKRENTAKALDELTM